MTGDESMRYVDFHTHILPGIDDGAQSVEQAINMLKLAKNCGAETVVLTPHYSSSNCSISDFCALRDEKVALLKDAMASCKEELPNIRVGAEVLIDTLLSDQEDLSKLCIDGTETIMLEFPHTGYEKWQLREVHNIVTAQNLTPLIAHAERYICKPKHVEKLECLISYGAKFQINAPSYHGFVGKRVITALVREGFVSAIGSDCHNDTIRTPDISRPLTAMGNYFSGAFFDMLYSRSCDLL